MRARVGDWLVVERARLGERRRTAQILEVRHADGTPPYLVRWTGTEETSLVFPGADAHVEPPEHDIRSLPEPGG